MYALTEPKTGTWTWVQPEALSGRWELHDGDEIVGSLELRHPSGTFAWADIGDETWTFKRVGFWRSHASIRRHGDDEDVAIFRNKTWSAGGTLEFADGAHFRATTNHWGSRYEFRDDEDETLVRFVYRGAFHLGAEVQIAPRGYELPQLPLLVLFGWWLAVMLYHDETWQVPQI